MTKTIGTLIADLNEKAEHACCRVRAEHLTISASYGTNGGVALVGGNGAERDRAAKFVETYFSTHLAPQRCLEAQYGYHDRGTESLARFPELIDGSWVEGAGRLVRGSHPTCQRVDARVISLVYWP